MPRAPDSSAQVGDTARGLERYVVLECVGRGGQSVVYGAKDRELNRRVAIKLLRVDADEDTSGTGGEARLLREAHALAKIAHPNVIPVYDVGRYGPGELQPARPELLEQDEFPSARGVFVVMEFVEGDTLAEWQRARRPAWGDALDVMISAGRGLAAAHAQGIVHRDFKPGNVIIGEDGRVRVLDFGLARGESEEPPSSDAQRSVPVSPELQDALTQAGTVLGTPKYMAPEQHLGRPASSAADQYSFCLVLCELLCGRYPFTGTTLLELRDQKTAGKLPAQPSGVPRRLWRVVGRGMSPEPGDRFASMPALLDELQRIRGRRKRLVWTMAAAVAITIGGGIGAYGWLQGRRGPCDGFELSLSGAWDPDVKRAARDTFFASDKPYAKAVWESVERGLDAYTSEWVSVRTQMCRAAQVGEGPTDPVAQWRNDCMHGALEAVRELGREFITADATVIEHGASAVSKLPSVRLCAEQDVAEAEIVRDQAQRERIAELEHELSRVKSQATLGRYEAATTRAQQVLDAAEAESLPGVVARAQLTLGDVARRAVNDEVAEEHLRACITGAERIGDEDLVTRAYVLLIRVLGRRLELEQAERLVDQVAARLERRGLEDELDAEYHGAVGVLRLRQGRMAEAAKAHARRLALLENLDPVDDTLLVDAMVASISTDISLGDFERGHERLQRALTLITNKLGPSHPRVGSVYYRLSVLEQRRDNVDLSLEHAQKALAIFEASHGPEHRTVARALNVIGGVHYRRQRYEEAREQFQRSADISRRILGPDHPDASTALGNVARCLTRLDRAPEAIELLEGQVGVLEKHYGPDHLEVAEAISPLATALANNDRREEALVLRRRSLAIIEQHFAPNHRDVGEALLVLGDLELTLGRTDDAKKTYERALKIFDGLGEFAPKTYVARTAFGLARAIEKSDPERALALAERAERAYAAANEDNPRVEKALETWLRERRKAG